MWSLLLLCFRRSPVVGVFSQPVYVCQMRFVSSTGLQLINGDVMQPTPTGRWKTTHTAGRMLASQTKTNDPVERRQHPGSVTRNHGNRRATIDTRILALLTGLRSSTDVGLRSAKPGCGGWPSCTIIAICYIQIWQRSCSPRPVNRPTTGVWLNNFLQ